MKRKQTRKEAFSSSNQCQYLIGKLHLAKDNIVEVIECICIAPYDKRNQAVFMDRYKIYRNAAKAISFYEGHDFEVIVITRSANGVCYHELTSFIGNEGLLQHG